jgi:hypothetical protein
MAQNDTPDKTLEEVVALMTRARSEAHAGIARKTKLVDARPAREDEVVVTVIKGEGTETQNQAKPGDWVVRNRCPETGDEQYIVRAEKFKAQYQKTDSPASGDWQEFQPVGKEKHYYLLPADIEAFTFVAPWGESMVARPGDVIVQDPEDEKDVYRVAAASFACTYQVVKAAKPRS